MKTKIIPIFVPHRGCPHDCIFCNQKKITGVSTDITKQEAKAIIEDYLKTIDFNCNIEIAFFGGSFTAIDINVQKDLLGIAKEYKDKGFVQDIRLSTRPDCIDSNILNVLKEYGVTIIELGVQSLDKDVLIKSYRGHDDKVVFESAILIKKYGFKLGLQMMVGLLGDNEQKSIYTAKEFVKLNPDFVRIYPTLVVSQTHLATLYLDGLYEPLNVEDTIQIVKKILVLFKKFDIKVIRVGLQPTDDIQLGKDILNGPYHPSIRELIESRIYRDYIERYIIKNDITKELFIYCNKKIISKIIGNKKINLKYFNLKYSIDLKVIQSDISSSIVNFKYKDDETIIIDGIYNELYYLYDLA